MIFFYIKFKSVDMSVKGTTSLNLQSDVSLCCNFISEKDVIFNCTILVGYRFLVSYNPHKSYS